MKLTALALLLVCAACEQENFQGCTLVAAPPTGNPDTDHANVQLALASVEPGDVVCLHKGTYKFADELDLSFVKHIEIRGSTMDDGTVFDFGPQTRGAYGLQVTTCDGFVLSHVAVLDAHGDAIRVSETTGVTFQDVVVEWTHGPKTSNGPYGLYPVSSSRILIDHCRVSGASDAGIYVGQSDTILVRNSEASGNVAGIEIENSTDAEVVGNWAHDNVGGILVFNLPGLPVKDGKRAKVHHNRVENNNQPQFADPAGIVSLVPSGTGIMVMASDSNEVHDNYVVNNESVGLALISWKTAQSAGRTDSDPTYDMYPQSNYVHDNSFSNNGYAPPEGTIAAAIRAGAKLSRIPDMVWDAFVDPTLPGTTGNNCFENNAGSFLDLDGPGFFNHPTTALPMCGQRTRLSPVLP